MSFKTKYIEYDIEKIIQKASQNVPIGEFAAVKQSDIATCVIEDLKSELPFANGRFGTPVSTDGRKISMQIAHGDYYPFGAASAAGTADVEARYACGLAYLDIDFGEDILSGGTQFVDCYTGVCGYKSQNIDVTFTADRERDLLAITLKDRRKVKKDFDVIMKSPHMPREINKGHTLKTDIFKRDENVMLKMTAAEKCDTGVAENDIFCSAAAGINIEISPTKWHSLDFEMMSEQCAKITVNQHVNTSSDPDKYAEEINIFIAGAVSYDKNADVSETVNDILYYSKCTDVKDIAERTAKWWSDFWSKSFILLDEKNKWLDATTILWIKLLYNMGLTKYGEYPVMHMTDILYGVNKCNVWGSGMVWFNNARYEYGMNVAGHAEMNEPLLKMIKRNYPKYETAARQRWGSKGIYIPEGSSTDGVEVYPEELDGELQKWYVDGEIPCDAIQSIEMRRGGRTAKNFTKLLQGDYTMRFCYDTANIAEIFRMRYLYSCDEEFLKNTAYPILRDAAEFYRNNRIVRKHSDGKYHIFPTNYAESLWGATDVIDDVSMIKSLLPVTADYAEKLGLDEDLVPLWREMAENMCDFVTADDKDAICGFRAPNGNAGFAMAKKPFFDISEYPEGWFPAQDEHIRPVMDYDLVTHETENDELKQLCMNTLEDCLSKKRIDGGYLKNWALDRFGTNCARLGRYDLAFLRMAHQFAKILRIGELTYDEIMNFEGNDAAMDIVMHKNIFDLQYWAYGEAIMECLIGCCPKRGDKTKNVIYIAPGWNMKYDAKFMLSARDGFDVCCEIKDGAVRCAEIYSKCGKTCVVKNTFGKAAVEFPDGTRKIYDGEYIEFDTKQNDVYCIKIF